VTAAGDVNVTRVGPALKGPGGFIDISQSTKRVNLMGTFTTGGLEVAVRDGGLVITKEGAIRKFVKEIPEIAFSGSNAVSRGQLVHYITERCVFALRPEGLELVELAPGIDLQTQVLDHMDFAPLMPRPPRAMDPRIFGPGRMRLLESLYSLDMAERLSYSAETRTLYVDLHGVSVTSPEAVAAIFGAIDAFFARAPALSKAVDVFVNYDGFDCREELVDAFAARAQAAEARHYGTVHRLSSAGFARKRLADSVQLTLQASYDVDEAFRLLRSMGHAVSRQTVATLCARFDRGAATAAVSVTSAELASIADSLKR
jgi:propionate CoA-transferase